MDSKDTITVSSGNSYRKQIGSGETFSDKEINGQGNPVEITATGKNWTIKNVVVRNTGTTVPFRIIDQGGSSLIENVFVENVKNNAFFCHSSHSGNIDVRYVHVRNIGSDEDFFYGSPPSNDDTDLWVRNTGKDRGKGGTINFFRCYGENIEGYCYRLGGAGSVVKECVAKNAKVPFATLYGEGKGAPTGTPVYFIDCDGSGYESGLRVGTHVRQNKPWNSNDVVAVAENVDISMRAGSKVQLNEHGWLTHRSPKTELRGSVGSNPDLSIPTACPRNANDVFDDERRAQQNGASAGSSWRHVVVDATRTDKLVQYELDCSASEVRMGDKADPQESIDGRIVKGEAGGGIDDFYANSEDMPHLNSAVVKGMPDDLRRVEITVDGESFAFEHDSKTGYAHDLRIDGTGAGRANYWIVLSDEAVAHERGDATSQGNDTCVQAGPEGEYVVSGVVHGGQDGWDSDSALIGAVVEGPGSDSIEILLDGSPIDENQVIRR